MCLCLFVLRLILQVKLPDDVMMDDDTTLASLAPIVKAGGVIPERWVIIRLQMSSLSHSIPVRLAKA